MNIIEWTFNKGLIYGHYIKFENVLYSKNGNKSLISVVSN